MAAQVAAELSEKVTTHRLQEVIRVFGGKVQEISQEVAVRHAEAGAKTSEVAGLLQQKLVDLDTQNRLYDLLWTVFPSTIRVLLDNRYVFQPFWDAKGRGEDDALWKAAFEGANRAARSSLGRGDTATVLSVVLARLYTRLHARLRGRCLLIEVRLACRGGGRTGRRHAT